MAPASDDMTALDRPVTHRELRAELAGLETRLATKVDFEAGFATLRSQLHTAKEELRAELATKSELHAAKEELRAEMSIGFTELRAYIEFSTKSVRDELRTHFDVTAESFRSEFRNLFDWAHANTGSLGTRVEALESGHGARLTAVETRVTRLEADDERGSRRSVKPKA